MSYLVLLKGITLEDLTKSLSTIKVSDIQQEKRTFDDFPKYFYSVDEWPKKTKLHCRICDQIPESYPKMIATCRFTDTNNNIIYGVEGPFHDWCCASLYITIYRHMTIVEMRSWLNDIEAMFSGRKKIVIPEANSPFLLKKYCGDTYGLTIEQWNRQNAEKTSREIIYFNTDPQAYLG
jgi:hypothetical protein